MNLKDKLLHSAYGLFAEKGFEKTTVSDIINAAGASKGGFYHHFESKEAVLLAITFNLTDEITNRYHEIRKEHPLSPIDEFNSVFATVNQAKQERVTKWNEFGAIYSFNDSHIFIRKMAERFEAATAGVYENIIKRGVDEGIFHADHPNHLAGMWTREILRLYSTIPHVIIPDGTISYDDFLELLKYSENLINRELGLPGKEIKVVKPALDFIEVCKAEYMDLLGGTAND